MARRISEAMHHRARFVGSFIKEHKGEGSMADLMRRAQAAYSGRHHSDSMPEERNPRGLSKGLVVAGVLAGALLLVNHAHSVQPKPPANPYAYPLYPTGPQLPSSSGGTSTSGF